MQSMPRVERTFADLEGGAQGWEEDLTEVPEINIDEMLDEMFSDELDIRFGKQASALSIDL